MNNIIIKYFTLNNISIGINLTQHNDYSLIIYENDQKKYSIYYPDKSLNYVKHEAEKYLLNIKRTYEY